jgi:hypothetical protein
MVEADSHLKLLSTSILDIYNVFEHIDMLSIGIQQQPFTVIPTLLGSDFGVHSGQNGAILRAIHTKWHSKLRQPRNFC